ncbi:MAG: tetraacyldisaccharide 4'-kinase [Planctomycetes bacterium]|nr:tetraacyldisaccharide 4'-kinase [Planctomycetota bacterium]
MSGGAGKGSHSRRGMAVGPRIAGQVAPRLEERLARRGGAIELLRVPAALFGVAARARGACYDLGLLRSARLDAAVVSVGNVTAGGTGKTPFVAWLVHELTRRGRRAGVLSRGYGAKVANSARGHTGAQSDEAALLAELVPGVEHVADPDRVRGGQALVERGVDVIVLDDGFQHRRLARDLDLALVDATRPWGLVAANGAPVRAFLPRGLLREPPSALARADALVLTRVDQCEASALEALKHELAELAPGRAVLESVHRPRAWLAPDGTRAPLDALRGRAAVLASGIAHPAAFESAVRALGVTVERHEAAPDHHAWSADDVARLARESLVVTTAKDAVKLRPLGAKVWTLAIEFELVAGASVLAALLDALPGSRAERARKALHEGLHG